MPELKTNKISAYIGISEDHLKALRISTKEIIKRINQISAIAKDHNIIIEKLTLEGYDLNNKNLKKIVSKIKTDSIKAINIPLTKLALKKDMLKKFREGLKIIKELSIVPSIHIHLDIGNAIAYSLYKTALEYLDTLQVTHSLLGLGERTGTLRSAEVYSLLYQSGFVKNRDLQKVFEAERYLKSNINNPLFDRKDFNTGDCKYYHTGGTHIRKILINPSTYVTETQDKNVFFILSPLTTGTSTINNLILNEKDKTTIAKKLRKGEVIKVKYNIEEEKAKIMS